MCTVRQNCHPAKAFLNTISKFCMPRGPEQGFFSFHSSKDSVIICYASAKINSHYGLRPLVDRGLEHGLVLNHIGDSILRFLPPLVVSEEQIDEMAERLEALINELA